MRKKNYNHLVKQDMSTFDILYYTAKPTTVQTATTKLCRKFNVIRIPYILNGLCL